MRAKVLIPLAGAAILGFLIFGRTGCGGRNEGFSAAKIKDDVQFEQVKRQAARMSLEPLRHFEDGERLTNDEIEALKQTENLFESLLEYEPKDLALHFGAGQVAFALEKYAKAETLLSEAVALAPDVPDATVIQLAAQSSYYLSMSRVFLQDFEGARKAIEEALARDPQNANYLAQLGSVFVQMRKIGDAKIAVRMALSYNPDHAKAQSLMRLIERAESTKKPGK